MLEDNFRTRIKKHLSSEIFKIETDNINDEFTKNELGLRLLQFFQYEQDPDFEKMFTKFLREKRWVVIKEHEAELQAQEDDLTID